MDSIHQFNFGSLPTAYLENIDGEMHGFKLSLLYLFNETNQFESRTNQRNTF